MDINHNTKLAEPELRRGKVESATELEAATKLAAEPAVEEKYITRPASKQGTMTITKSSS